jgi:hypothetical protein
MNIPNFREKGTKLPNLPKETLYNVVPWEETSQECKFLEDRGNFISFGYKSKNGFDYILCDVVNYTGDNYYMVKESIVIDLWKKENNWTEDTFVLPEKWKLKVSRLEDIEEYLINKYGKVDKWILENEIEGLILYSNSGQNFRYPKYISYLDVEDYTEITFEQFQKYVLKKEVYTIEDLANGKCMLNTTGGTNEEIKKVLNAAYPNTKSLYGIGSKYYWTNRMYYWNNNDIGNKTLPEQSIQEFLKQIKQIKQEKMEKQIIGYKLIKPEYKYAVLKILNRTHFTQTPELTQDWSINKIKEAGVLDLWFQPVYKEYEKFIQIGHSSFTLRVNSGGIFHGTENITDYVKSIFEWNKTIPTKFGKYDFKVESIILSKTGCENKSTSVQEWVDVWREYQELV